MTRFQKDRESEPLKGLLAGMAGGLLAAWIMNQFQSVWSKAAEALQREEQSGQQEQQQQGGGEDATMKAANRLARVSLGRELTKEEKKKAGPAVHYAFGALMGGLYGLTSEYVPSARAGFGLLFGAALFAIADEIAVPALGLSKKPWEYPLSAHAYGLVSHSVYGLSTEAVRRGVRAVA